MCRSRTLLLIVGAVAVVGSAAAALVTGVLRVRFADDDAGAPMALQGTYVHRGSGIEFPEQVGEFHRTAPRQYDEKGDDVGVGYARRVDGARLESTIFVFPPPRHPDGRVMSAAEQFEAELAEKRSGKAGLRSGPARESASTYAMKPVTVRWIDFEYRSGGLGGRGAVSVATLHASIRCGDWHLTYMATVGAEHRDAAWRAVDELAQRLALPSLGTAVAPSTPERAGSKSRATPAPSRAP